MPVPLSDIASEIKALRITYLATADACGHLMRAQLLTHALRAAGAQVQVITTSDKGVRFLAGFGIEATVLSRHYAVQFDALQNMLRRETDRNVAQYVFHPERMLRDVVRLHAVLRTTDLLVNDSFHPALLFMGAMPWWRRKIVQVYGSSLRRALETNFDERLPKFFARLFGRTVAWLIGRSRARVEHDFAYGEPQQDGKGGYRLPTPVAVVGTNESAGCEMAGMAAVYLNPHFTHPLLAQGMEQGLAAAGLNAILVGEGYARRPGWRGQDERWVEAAAQSACIVSAPGMAALSIAAVYRKPILLLLTDQPEQAINAERSADFGLIHHVVKWRGDPDAFARDVTSGVHSLRELSRTPVPDGATGHERATTRLQRWVTLFLESAL